MMSDLRLRNFGFGGLENYQLSIFLAQCVHTNTVEIKFTNERV
jgi:hypothetical protein